MSRKDSFFSILFSEKLRIVLYKLSKQLKKQFKDINYDFDIINFYNLHMTFIFNGELLNNIKNDTLLIWNKNINNIIQKINETNFEISMFTLELNSNNFIIVKFNVPEYLHILYNDVVNNSSILFENNKDINEFKNKNQGWLPQIILGEIYAPISITENILKNININSNTLYKINGIHLNGNRPNELNLNWRYLF